MQFHPVGAVVLRAIDHDAVTGHGCSVGGAVVEPRLVLVGSNMITGMLFTNAVTSCSVAGETDARIAMTELNETILETV